MYFIFALVSENFCSRCSRDNMLQRDPLLNLLYYRSIDGAFAELISFVSESLFEALPVKKVGLMMTSSLVVFIWTLTKRSSIQRYQVFKRILLHQVTLLPSWLCQCSFLVIDRIGLVRSCRAVLCNDTNALNLSLLYLDIFTVPDWNDDQDSLDFMLDFLSAA